MFRINKIESWYRQNLAEFILKIWKKQIEIGKTKIVQPELRRIFRNTKTELREIKTECRQNVDGNKMDQFG